MSSHRRYVRKAFHSNSAHPGHVQDDLTQVGVGLHVPVRGLRLLEPVSGFGLGLGSGLGLAFGLRPERVRVRVRVRPWLGLGLAFGLTPERVRVRVRVRP